MATEIFERANEIIYSTLDMFSRDFSPQQAKTRYDDIDISQYCSRDFDLMLFRAV